ncbi:MAG: hypothetical protein HWD85_05005 [Flavobacteriaceae bacterium]|nr:hypothetical protein [Flavobacteriaceae bacterium]
MMVLFATNAMSQKNDHYYNIPPVPKTYTATSVASRMVDGLGFRYYWATNGLTEKDLKYKLTEKGRSTQETVSHLYDLSNMMLRLTKTTVQQLKPKKEMSFSEMRTQTLLNFKGLSDRLKSSSDLKDFDLVKDGKLAVPFWKMINGPIADAIWHTGQIASFRRASGNPINPKINHFSGTVRE